MGPIQTYIETTIISGEQQGIRVTNLSLDAETWVKYQEELELSPVRFYGQLEISDAQLHKDALAARGCTVQGPPPAVVVAKTPEKSTLPLEEICEESEETPVSE